MRLHRGRDAAKIEGGPVRRDCAAPPLQSRTGGGRLQARPGRYGAARGVADRAGAVISERLRWEGDRMKTYRGGRSLDGAGVTVDGQPLSPRYDLKRLSAPGFEWTYEGAGPAQLALALVADHLG